MYSKFVIEKLLNRHHFFIDQKKSICIYLVILRDYYFFLKSIFGVTIG